MVLRLLEECGRQDRRALVAREIKYHEVADMVCSVRMQAPEGMKKALTFWASTRRSGLTKPLPMPTAAERGGSCPQYLHDTIVDLEAEGTRDRNLWHLQALVAERTRAKQAA